MPGLQRAIEGIHLELGARNEHAEMDEESQKGTILVKVKAMVQSLPDSEDSAKQFVPFHCKEAVGRRRQETKPWDHSPNFALLGNRHKQAIAGSNGAPQPERAQGTRGADANEKGVVRIDMGPEEHIFIPTSG
jgi:hypothetical protein